MNVEGQRPFLPIKNIILLRKVLTSHPIRFLLNFFMTRFFEWFMNFYPLEKYMCVVRLFFMFGIFLTIVGKRMVFLGD